MRIIVVFCLVTLIGCSGKTKEEVYYPDGSLKEIRSYVNGLRHGEYIMFHDNGDTSRIYVYKQDSLKSMRLLINNQTLIYQEFKDTAIKHGKEIFYHPNGQIETIAEFEDGIPHGATLGYYKDGSKRTIMNYEKGKGVGEFKQYYPNGNLYVSSNEYSSGVITYHDSTGVKKYDFLMKNGGAVDTLKVY